MKLIAQLSIPGIPVAKARPRIVSTGRGKVYAYTVKGTAEAEENIRRHLMVALGSWQGTKHAYKIKLLFAFPLTGKHRDQEAHLSKPDADNLEKLTFDALKPWIKDEWISHHETVKCYAVGPATEIEIWEGA